MPVGSWDSAAPPQGVVVPLPVQLARPKSRARTRPSLAMTPPEVQGQPSLCPSDRSAPHHDRVGEGLASPAVSRPRRLMGFSTQRGCQGPMTVPLYAARPQRRPRFHRFHGDGIPLMQHNLGLLSGRFPLSLGFPSHTRLNSLQRYTGCRGAAFAIRATSRFRGARRWRQCTGRADPLNLSAISDWRNGWLSLVSSGSRGVPTRPI